MNSFRKYKPCITAPVQIRSTNPSFSIRLFCSRLVTPVSTGPNSDKTDIRISRKIMMGAVKREQTTIDFFRLSLLYHAMSGKIAAKVTALSFEKLAMNMAIMPRIKLETFCVFSHLVKFNAAIQKNNKANISSRLFRLATTSVCIGCAAKTSVINNGQ